MKKLWGKEKDKIQAALERLDQLTKDEGLSAVAQILGVVHGIGRVVAGGASYFRNFLIILSKYLLVRWKSTDGWYRTEFGYVSLAKQVSP